MKSSLIFNGSQLPCCFASLWQSDPSKWNPEDGGRHFRGGFLDHQKAAHDANLKQMMELELGTDVNSGYANEGEFLRTGDRVTDGGTASVTAGDRGGAVESGSASGSDSESVDILHALRAEQENDRKFVEWVRHVQLIILTRLYGVDRVGEEVRANQSL